MNGSRDKRAFGSSELKAAEVGIVVRRADGRIEDYGVVAQWHRNPFVRWARHLGVVYRAFLRQRTTR